MPRRVLLCPPDDYGISYEINPWMSVKRQPDQVAAYHQWKALYKTLEDTGFWVRRLPQQAPNFPDMVFTANAGLVYDGTIVLSRFKHQERKGEIAYFRNWFLSSGYQFKTLPAGYFEGEGDALWAGNNLFCGYGDFRSDELGMRLAADIIGAEPILLRLTDSRFYHLDTCFCALRKDLFLCYLPAFDRASQDKIEQFGEIIPVSPYDARNFVCNALVAGNKIITTQMSHFLRNLLKERYGIELVELCFSEFIKAGGAAKCLTLFI